MISISFVTVTVLLLHLVSHSPTLAFPQYGSLAGLSAREWNELIPRLNQVDPPNPPEPLKYNGTKLVHDSAHPFEAPEPGDIRGPCPGLNTLANHGYLPHNGVASPSQIVNAVQEGFNMEHGTAVFLTHAAHLVDGNLVTDLLSIGEKTSKTGPDPPAPAIVGGLNTHAVFEGDVSMTRGDFFFGDNHSFNQTLFDQFVDYSSRYGGGFYNYTVAAELRFQRIQQSIATNPQFSFIAPRYFTAYAESVFPVNFFVDGRSTEKKLDMEAAALFFRDGKYPTDFHRAAQPSGTEGVDMVFMVHPIAPGGNQDDKVNNYVLDPTSADFDTFCLLYTNFVNQTIRGLYPNPTGVLRRNLIKNLGFFYSGIADAGCEELFPYGKL
ncbi:heme-thiolate peroxidase [Candolleomyces aberdarensis]|uniref:Heme-thiolate peroxidase n=1 Tax=Candolleomyces aberdarensis TaxID=2316362 RepID=A0A4Q2D9Y7_9AGAR|nr:heme-thiolate peroxidase [Candolleomyces aberdarensis]